MQTPNTLFDTHSVTGTAQVLRYSNERGAELSFSLAGQQRTTLGRGSDCHLVLPDSRVSRLHASIEAVDHHHLLRDEGSSNGTFLNGLRLTPGSAFSLRDGDVIEVGSQRFAYGAQR